MHWFGWRGWLSLSQVCAAPFSLSALAICCRYGQNHLLLPDWRWSLHRCTSGIQLWLQMAEDVHPHCRGQTNPGDDIGHDGGLWNDGSDSTLEEWRRGWSADWHMPKATNRLPRNHTITRGSELLAMFGVLVKETEGRWRLELCCPRYGDLFISLSCANHSY